MDKPIDSNADFWNYLSPPQKDLLKEGDYLMNDVIKHSTYQFKDYSFLVFPFAKAYEGFLKTLFKDIKFISHLDYISDHLRLGKLMSPHMVMRLGERSLYTKIETHVSRELADKIWDAWKRGRNQVFHYFPHNTKSLTFTEAKSIIENMLATMELAYRELHVDVKSQNSDVKAAAQM